MDTSYINLEDIFITGLSASKCNVTLKNSPWFNFTGKKMSRIRGQDVLIHNVRNDTDLYRIYEKLHWKCFHFFTRKSGILHKSNPDLAWLFGRVKLIAPKYVKLKMVTIFAPKNFHPAHIVAKSGKSIKFKPGYGT